MKLAATVVAFCIASAAGFAQTVPPRFTLDYEALAKRIVEQLAFTEGETFLILAHPGKFEELIPFLRYEVMRAGAVDLGVMDVLAEPVPETWDEGTLREGGRVARRELHNLFQGVDASIMLPGAVPGQPAYAAIQDLLREGKGRTIHFHWLDNGSVFPLPGQPLPPRHVIEALYQRAVLETDYRALGDHQTRFEEAIRNAEIRVTDPDGTDIRFRIGDRPVNRQDGDASKARGERGVILIDREIELPAGAVRVAPLEETVQGVIAFPTSQWSGHPVEDLKLVFERGKVVSIEASKGREWAEREIDDAGEAGRSFREIALGFNPILAVPEADPWIPYYGYGAGVVRLSLGDNTELGGNVTGGYVRWNFFVDTTLQVDGEVWVRGGRLVH